VDGQNEILAAARVETAGRRQQGAQGDLVDAHRRDQERAQHHGQPTQDSADPAQATEALRLLRLGYEKGDPKYDYTSLLQAQRTLVQSQLAHVQARGDLWRAISEVAGLLQSDTLGPPKE